MAAQLGEVAKRPYYGPRHRAVLVRRATVAGVLAAHFLLLVLVGLELTPAADLASPGPKITPVYLARVRQSPTEVRRHVPAHTPPPPARPRVPEALPSEVSQPPAKPADVMPHDSAERLAAALRGSPVGCANLWLLSETEQNKCKERLGEGAKLAAYIPVPIPPERRAYYDAIAQAKAPPTAANIVPLGGARNIRRLSGGTAMILDEADLDSVVNPLRNMGGKGPRIGCSIKFHGPGSGRWRTPVHGLKLGPLPCHLLPPMTQWTPEAGIQNPDELAKPTK